ncbi:YaeQ family protein [Microbacterium telephonicum]|uniref:Uncharacterized protein YaeQ n=1 Tax=Microbacterium telephonicum TaxID=1714841 RepID=A0A498C342_9MICO|nr:YaeQ family protein [Microbacterium telephonicum]RLK49427.1 uncharacterized protein YaeQ [Microbacterium telephonicum]
MAAGATVHTFTAQLADIDRGMYEDLELRLARHPSETAPFLLMRVLAYCLEFEDGIVFSEGISATDQPAVMVRDLTGALQAWIEVGAPDAARLHTGSLQSERVAVYTLREPAKLVTLYAGKKIHRADDIVVRGFEPGFLDDAAAAIERRNTVTVSLTEGRLYLDVNGRSFSSEILTARVG